MKKFSMILLLIMLLTVEASADSKPINCKSCHEGLASQKVVHLALQAGCQFCHTALDAATVPHTQKGSVPNGLSQSQPKLCYQCHAAFTGKSVHPALLMGCTACHNPHSSPNKFLLKQPVPELCFSCHGTGRFTKSHVHPPVHAGKCLTCHNPHASGNMKLLIKTPEETCLQCHAKVATSLHVIADSFEGNHPIGLTKPGEAPLPDPAQPGQPFFCGSCHDPHSSDSVRLFLYGARKGSGLCIHCHKDVFTDATLARRKQTAPKQQQ